MPQPMPWVRKYQPLADHLAAQSADEVTLSFAQIEAILRATLPATAYLRFWWTNTSVAHPQVRAWRQAGWEVASLVRRDGEWVATFRRRPADAVS